jgi:hypothetical protein
MSIAASGRRDGLWLLVRRLLAFGGIDWVVRTSTADMGEWGGGGTSCLIL